MPLPKQLQIPASLKKMADSRGVEVKAYWLVGKLAFRTGLNYKVKSTGVKYYVYSYVGKSDLANVLVEIYPEQGWFGKKQWTIHRKYIQPFTFEREYVTFDTLTQVANYLKKDEKLNPSYKTGYLLKR